MPGLLHEFIVSLFTDRPSLAVDLYAAADASNLPAYDEVSGGKQSLSQATTAAYDADEVVVLNHGGVPQLALIVEVQLRADEGKRFSWPGYAVSARFSHSTARAGALVSHHPWPWISCVRPGRRRSCCRAPPRRRCLRSLH
ncbi:MAG: hypothetical protein ACE366_24585 [Bradymonadia bacterium]